MKSCENAPSQQALAMIERKFPELAETLNYIAKLQQATRVHPYLEFVEHVAVVGFEKDQAGLALLTPDLLATWITHMSHGTRLRMEVLEDAILRWLADGQLLIPAILARCHLEVAGFAAQNYFALCRFSETREVEPLKKYILETSYSSALAKEDPTIITSGAIPGVCASPRSVMNAVDSLQKFYDSITGTPLLKLRQLYAQLCDFSHPGILGIRGFVEVRGPHRNGRRLQYTRNEKLEYPDALNLVTALLWSMRGGHVCAALMYCGEIIEEEKGFRYDKADRESGQFVWEHILQREEPS